MSTTGIVERLREFCGGEFASEVMSDAADEIDRLRRLVAVLRDPHKAARRVSPERLRAWVEAKGWAFLDGPNLPDMATLGSSRMIVPVDRGALAYGGYPADVVRTLKRVAPLTWDESLAELAGEGQ